MAAVNAQLERVAGRSSSSSSGGFSFKALLIYIYIYKPMLGFKNADFLNCSTCFELEIKPISFSNALRDIKINSLVLSRRLVVLFCLFWPARFWRCSVHV